MVSAYIPFGRIESEMRKNCPFVCLSRYLYDRSVYPLSDIAAIVRKNRFLSSLSRGSGS